MKRFANTLDYFVGSFDFLVMGFSIPVALGWCRRMTHDIWLLALFVLSCAFLADSSYNPFIYFKF